MIPSGCENQEFGLHFPFFPASIFSKDKAPFQEFSKLPRRELTLPKGSLLLNIPVRFITYRPSPKERFHVMTCRRVSAKEFRPGDLRGGAPDTRWSFCNLFETGSFRKIMDCPKVFGYERIVGGTNSLAAWNEFRSFKSPPLRVLRFPEEWRVPPPPAFPLQRLRCG